MTFFKTKKVKDTKAMKVKDTKPEKVDWFKYVDKKHGATNPLQ